jgi:AcrR family transcriptional regulator
MLIHHFGSREELLGEVIQVIVDREHATFRELEASAEEVSGEIVVRVWDRLRSPDLAPQERLFFEIYGQALQGRQRGHRPQATASLPPRPPSGGGHVMGRGM